MASTGLKKMFILIISNAEGVMVLVCPAIFWTLDGFSGRCFTTQKAPSPIHDHSIRSGHEVTIDNFSIVGREDQSLIRTIKEAFYIRVNNPSLNKNIGKYHLPHIWDEVLYNSSELKLK